MSSDLPKVLHEIGGRPLLSYVIESIRPLCGGDIYIVVGYKAEEVEGKCQNEGVHFVLQAEQLGTGHAVIQCREALEGFSGTVMVLNGDVPCLRPETIRQFSDYHHAQGAAATVMSAKLPDPFGYGRIVRDGSGALSAIVEQKDADEETQGISEINSGLFCFDKDKLFRALDDTDQDNAQNEFYLTDVIEVLNTNGDIVRAYCVEDADEVAGVNTDDELDAIRRRLEG
jgi:bifunctional UDP-N-acetylglucosamine pyrophosphorylase/glucosamine-1-phosphate N-acetyltransferase